MFISPRMDLPLILEAPERRKAIRDDFPRVIKWHEKGDRYSSSFNRHAANPADVIRTEMTKVSQATHTGRITIAYPHKGAGFFTYKPHRLTAVSRKFTED